MNSYPPDSDLSIFRTIGPRRTINTVLSEIVCFDPETVDVHNSTMPSGLKTGIKLFRGFVHAMQGIKNLKQLRFNSTAAKFFVRNCSYEYKRFHINNSM